MLSGFPTGTRSLKRQGHGRNRGRTSRVADFGTGEGGLLEAVREYITPKAIMETPGSDPSTSGVLMAAPRAGDEMSFTPQLPPRMQPKDVQ